MISPRYAVPVAVMLALALVPTVIHSYRGVRVNDDRRTAAIAATLDGMASTPTARRAPWVKNHFESDDWIERTYTRDRTSVTLFVARSYDAKRLYHHPELALLRGAETTPRGTAYVAARPDVPLHLIEIEQDGRRGLAVYALHYDGRFIDNPVLFQLRASASLLVSGRRPLTLFMATDLEGRRDALDKSPAARVLLEAIGSFERQLVTAAAH